jgi:transcription elongation GreA/GreB family factor
MITFSKKYNSANISEKIIRLNSAFILVTEHNKKQLVRIVLPHNIQNSSDISIYNPIAIACLGAKEGNQVCFQYKDTLQKLHIEKSIVYPVIIPADLTDLLEIPYAN